MARLIENLDLIKSHPWFTPIALALASIATIILISYLIRYLIALSRPPHVAALYIYPVKSCRGVKVDSITLTRLGFKYDREWMIINSQTGHMVSAREYPHMVLIAPEIDEQANTLTLRYDNESPLVVSLTRPSASAKVTVWDDHIEARRYGDEATQWITRVINSKSSTIETPAADNENEDGATSSSAPKAPPQFHLVSIVSTEKHSRPLDPKYNWNGESHPNQSSFSDGFPLLLANESSLRLLNRWTRGRRVVEMEAFRPNIIMAGGRITPFDEDSWRSVMIGSIQCWAAKPCERCIMTTVVPSEGKRHPTGEPLISLREKRKLFPKSPRFKDSVFFGQNLIPSVSSGKISLNDPIRVIERKPTKLEFYPEYTDRVAGSEDEKERLAEYGFVQKYEA